MRIVLLLGVVAWHVGSFNLAAGESESMHEALFTFTEKFDKAMVKNAGKSNIVWSPLSTWTVLSITSKGAKETTKSQICSVLDVSSSNDWNIARSLTEMFHDVPTNVDPAYKLLKINEIFLHHDIQLNGDFDKSAQWTHNSDIQTVDFDESAETANIINQWTAENTNDRVSTPVDADAVSSDTKLVIANVVNFEGSWINEFESEETRQPFHVDKKTIKNVTTMKVSGSFVYGNLPNVNASFVELPYKVNAINNSAELGLLQARSPFDGPSLYVVLPQKQDGLAELVENFEFATLFKPLTFIEPVDIRLPKFTVETSINFANELVKQHRAGNIFSSSANFSGITDDLHLKISGITHKASIEVNEKGSKVTGNTNALFNLIRNDDNDQLPGPIFETLDGLGPRGSHTLDVESRRPGLIGRHFRRQYIPFNADHPFLIVLAYKENKIPLAIAIVNDPTGSADDGSTGKVSPERSNAD